MPIMLRTSKKARKIVWSILGRPENMSKKDKKNSQRLTENK